MSSSPARGLRWWLCLIGLLLLVASPWLYALMSQEARFEHLILAGFGSAFSLVGLVYQVGFLNVLVHEAGHWFFGRLVGIRISDFVVGTGDAPLRFTWRGVRFAFGPWIRWGYVRQVVAFANLRFSRQLVFLSGGVLAELLFVGVVCWKVDSHFTDFAFAEALGRFRFYLLVTVGLGLCASLWPRMVNVENRQTPNDGLLIVQAWRDRGKAEETWREVEWGNRVNALAQEGKYAEAAALVEAALARDAEKIEWWRGLATLHTLAGQIGPALSSHHAILDRLTPQTTEHSNAVDVAATLALQWGQREELAKIRPLVEEAYRTSPTATLAGTLGSVLLELDEVEAGVALLNKCVKESAEPHDVAIGNAYLAKAALRVGQSTRAAELLASAKARCPEHELVARLVAEVEPQLEKVAVPQK